jgi:hypothetical protein
LEEDSEPMAIEIKVVTKPGEGFFSSLLLGTGNWPLWADEVFKGATPIETVKDLVNLVSRRTAPTEGAAPELVEFIQINGHGNTKGFDIGKDWIDLTTVDRFRSDFGLIASHLTENGAVEISACKAGAAKELMRKLSLYLGGVAIIGYLFQQQGGLPPVGPPVIVTPGGSYSPAAPAAGTQPPSPPPPSR